MSQEKTTTTPKAHGPMRGPGVNSQEKAKDFKKAIKRLLKEINDFKVLIIVSLVLAIMGAILSILAPNRLSDLTDEISNGLVVNTENLEQLTKSVTSSFNDEDMQSRITDILAIDLSRNTIKSINSSNDLTKEDKEAFREFSDSVSNNPQEIFNKISLLPESILNIILPNSTYEDVKITTSDKIDFVKSLNNIKSQDNIDIPNSIGKVLFDEIIVDNTKISSSDQTEFLELMSSVDEDSSTTTIYKQLDKMPNSIRSFVEPTMNIDKIKTLVLILVIMYVCSALCTYIEQIAMTDVANKFAKKLRSNISNKINCLPLKYFDNHATGDILSRVTNDVDTIAQSMNQSLATLVSSITLLLGTLIMMFYTNWIMALTAIGASLIGFIFMLIVLSKSQKYFISRQVELGNLNGHIEEIYSGLNVVKAYNGQKEADVKFDEYNKKVYEANRKSQFLSGLMMPMMNFIGNFGYVAVCIVGALLTMNGHISFGVIVAFITYVRLFTSPLSQIAQAMTSLQSSAAASERIFEFVDEEEMSSQDNITKYLDKDKVKGEIEFKNVVFQYDGNDQPTIKNFSAKAHTGQKIAIVGPTGAGKTTMVNLLIKFYEINSGDILIDGISTKDLTRENIHSLFTMVLQDTWMFEGSVKENIIYNRKDISDERVKEVCKIVGLDHFIKTLPNGYNSALTENDSVSAGQKQLLTIARGMIEEAQFLILDEATSNVDTRTEELVQSAMDKLTQGRTSFIIAHRLSTIKNADLILVMKDGNIIETGNHEELMKKKGFYADLYNSQFEL